MEEPRGAERAIPGAAAARSRAARPRPRHGRAPQPPRPGRPRREASRASPAPAGGSGAAPPLPRSSDSRTASPAGPTPRLPAAGPSPSCRRMSSAAGPRLSADRGAGGSQRLRGAPAAAAVPRLHGAALRGIGVRAQLTRPLRPSPPPPSSGLPDREGRALRRPTAGRANRRARRAWGAGPLVGTEPIRD